MWCMSMWSDTGSLVFIDDVTEDGSSWINSAVYRYNLWVQIHPHLVKAYESISWSQSRWFTLQLLKAKLNAERPMIWKVETHSLLMCWPSFIKHLISDCTTAFGLLKIRGKSSSLICTFTLEFLISRHAGNIHLLDQSTKHNVPCQYSCAEP